MEGIVMNRQVVVLFIKVAEEVAGSHLAKADQPFVLRQNSAHEMIDWLSYALSRTCENPKDRRRDHLQIELRDRITELWHHGPREDFETGDLEVAAALHFLREKLGW